MSAPEGAVDLSEISQLARLLVDYDREVEAAEEALRKVKENARRVREEALPSAMESVGLTTIKLASGEKVEVKPEVYCSIPVDGREKAYRWLEDNGFGSLIKTEVSMSFGRNERERAQKLAASLMEQGYPAEMAMSVHAQTLKAIIKEQLEAAKPIPLDLFGARPVSVAKVTLPKTK